MRTENCQNEEVAASKKLFTDDLETALKTVLPTRETRNFLLKLTSDSIHQTTISHQPKTNVTEDCSRLDKWNGRSEVPV